MIGRYFFKPASRADLTQFSSLGLMLVALLVCTDGHALYKVVDPDGKVIYTDRPPAPQALEKVVPVDSATSSGNSTPLANLPIAVRDAAIRYPVVLYTALDCTACDNGRNMLRQRGIPFAERQIITGKDTEALQKKTGVRDLPVMTIGTQVNRGFDADLWAQYLTAAGYPLTSQLPRSYVQSLPQPLTEPVEASTESVNPTLAPIKRPSPPAPPPPPSTAPGGIQF